MSAAEEFSFTSVALMNKERTQEDIREMDAEIQNYPFTGPLGSSDAVCPIDETELLNLRTILQFIIILPFHLVHLPQLY